MSNYYTSRSKDMDLIGIVPPTCSKGMDLECEFCSATFKSDMNGFIGKTLHCIIEHGERLTEEEKARGLCFEFTKKEFEN